MKGLNNTISLEQATQKEGESLVTFTRRIEELMSRDDSHPTDEQIITKVITKALPRFKAHLMQIVGKDGGQSRTHFKGICQMLDANAEAGSNLMPIFMNNVEAQDSAGANLMGNNRYNSNGNRGHFQGRGNYR